MEKTAHMSIRSRILNLFRRDRLNRDLDDEMQSHLEEAAEQGRDPGDARRAFGSPVRWREQSRDVRLIPWLDSLRSDGVFGWRQLLKRKTTSAAAILSLGLAIGACTTAFRLIDAILLRPLPVAHPERLFTVVLQGIESDGTVGTAYQWAYPAFQQMRAAVKRDADLVAISDAQRMDVSFGADQQTEKASLQYVSGWMFDCFGLRPAAGRLFTEDDDSVPGAHPYAVISEDYWTRRFGRDPDVIGRTFRLGNAALFSAPGGKAGLYQIIGVVNGPFTGTDTGTVTDIFVPTMMHPAVTHDDWTWHRIMARLKTDGAMGTVRDKLQVTSHAFEENRAKGFTGMTKEVIAQILALKVVLEPAAQGASGLQHDYRRALIALGVLVTLVLLIACANIANLMTAQAAARARELALRVSIGAGKWRLAQLVLVESAWLGVLSAVAGGLFASWAAPFVVSRINPPDNPIRLSLPADARVIGFGVALTLAVTLLFGLAPALRASGVKPASALKGGDDPHSRRRLMHGLIAVQVAFSFVVIFAAGLFAATFDRLSTRPMGFSTNRVLLLETAVQRAEPSVVWNQVADHLRSVPGVESVALANFPLLSGGDWNGFISVNGAPPGPDLAHFLAVSPGWMDTMRMQLAAGRDFRPTDTQPGAAIVNEAFVKQFFNGENPIGKMFAKGNDKYQAIGIARDAPYVSIREAIVPVVYVPFHGVEGSDSTANATLVVRTLGANPLAMAATLRREVQRARPEFRVSSIRTQEQLVRAQTVRERLLAMLGLFFAGVALLLAGIGLYGVLDYSVLQRRREIGIRMAIGARAPDIARRVTTDVFVMVVLGAAAGLALGLAAARTIATLLYGVKATDAGPLAIPALAICVAALIAALPAVIRAVRIDPVKMLRSE